MRIAIISTPRSGNTWLRHIFASQYGLDQVAAHSPSNLEFKSLPSKCALQIHWHYSSEFMELLDEYGFRVVTIARHPLDVLISILHFAPHEPQTAQWLDGDCGEESSIFGITPTSSEFFSYATGPRAGALLAVSKEWWNMPNVIQIRYEDLVKTPEEAIKLVCNKLDASSANIADVLESLTIEKLQQTSTNQHFWKGRPGLWKALLPSSVAHAIAAKHKTVFTTLGFSCDPDVNLSTAVADVNWLNILENK